MLINELEGLDQSQDFIDISSDWQVIDALVSDDSFGIDDESGSIVCGWLIFYYLKAAPLFSPSLTSTPKLSLRSLLRSPMSGISSPPKPPSSLGFWSYSMCENTESTEQPRTSQSMQVDKVQNFTCFSEELGLLRELDDFSGTDKGEVERIEEQNDIFSLVISQVDILEISLEPSFSLELWSWRHHCGWLVITQAISSTAATLALACTWLRLARSSGHAAAQKWQEFAH